MTTLQKKLLTECLARRETLRTSNRIADIVRFYAAFEEYSKSFGDERTPDLPA